MTTSSSWLGRSSALFLSACALGSTLGCNTKATTGAGGSTGTTTTGTMATGTTTTGSGSTSGTGGSVPTGPITGVPENTWTWVDFPDSRCMNDTPTGIGVNFTSASKDVVIFLEGGNACFNTVSCLLTYNAAGYGATMPPPSGSKQSNFMNDVTTFLSSALLFSRTDATNPLKNFNYIYVPYCTGDLHFGDATGMVGGANRNFHGYKNMQSFLKRITATFPTPGNVILTGVSAGGFGAALNYDQTAQAFGSSVKVKLLDDSGPPMAETYIPLCLQQAFATTWGFANTLPKGCTACAGGGVFTEPLSSYLMTTYPDRTLGLISSTQDGTISKFLGYGDNNCATITGLQQPGPYLGTEYAAGVADLRDRIAMGHPNFYTYYIDGTNGQDNTRHVWLDNPAGVTSNGVVLLDWLTKFVAADASLVDVPPQMPAGG